VGPSDWEADGRVRQRTVSVASFRIDAHEVTEARYLAWREPQRRIAPTRLPMGNVSLAEASQFCAAKRGRLPTEDEWMSAAASDARRRYPWGDTGAVCIRASWGKSGGPCGRAAHADAVGAHPRGSRDGVFDLAGNVSEWVTLSGAASFDVAKGGSWQSALATELRIWSRAEHPLGFRDRATGFRCAYDAM
jgi:formylglycine-generating enzyme required for sulfatase activity